MNTNKTPVSKLAFAFSATLLMLVLCSISSFSSNVVSKMIFAQAPDTLVQPAAIPDTTAGTGAVFTEVEVMPDFSYKSMHGAEAFSNYIVDSFIFPSGLGEISFQARYSVSFVVEVDGHISTINLVRRLDPTTDKEIVRVISNAPRWIPGEHKGKKVRVAYSISVLIKI